MKTNYTTWLLWVACSASLIADDITLPSLEELESIAAQNGDLIVGEDAEAIKFEVGDFDNPELGKIKKSDLKWLREVQTKTSGALNALQSSQIGPNVQWFNYISDLNSALGSAVSNNSSSELVALMEPLRMLKERDEEEPFCEQLDLAESYLTQCGTYIIRALAYQVEWGNGVLEDGVVRDAVKLFGNGKLVDESAWDVDDVMPIDSAGLFIMNPGLVLEELKKRPVERVRFFLCGVSEAGEYFRRYGEGGDGLEVLKGKYGENREVIEGKYAEAVAWLAAQGGGE